MSIVEQVSFLTKIHPFDRLSTTHLNEAAAALDVVYFPLNTKIPLDLTENAFIYIVIKGRVSECMGEDGAGQCGLYGINSQFGASTLLDQQARLSYQAIEETLAYRLPFATFQN